MTARKLPKGISIHDGHIHIDYTLRGQRMKRSIGPVGAVTISDAVAIRNVEVGQAILAGEVPTRAKKVLTVSELLDRFEAARAAGTTKIGLSPAHSRHLRAGLGAVALDRLGIVQLVGFRRKRLSERVEVGKKRTRMVGPATVSRELATLRAILNWAAAERLPIGKESIFDHMSKDARRSIFPKEKNSAEPARISDEDLGKIVANLPEYAKPVPLIAVRTGARLMELIRLDWSEVDLQSAPPSIRPRNTKNKKARTIPLAPSAVALLPARPAEGGLVFRGPRDGKMLHNFPRSWNIARVKAGLPGTKFHSLRHEFATRYCEAGGDLRSLQAIGGWSSLNLVERYSRANLSRAVDVIEKAACQ